MKSYSEITAAILPIFGFYQVSKLDNGKLEVTGGHEYEFIKLVFQGLKIPYKIVLPDIFTFGDEKDDGNWTGLTGMVQSNKADIAFPGTYYLENKTKVVDYSYPYTFLKTTFATRKPRDVYSPLTFIYPFDSMIWICTFLTLITLVLAFKYLIYRRYSFQYLIFEVLGCLLHQPFNINKYSKKTVQRILFISLMWAAFFISLSYSSVLLSFLTIPFQEKSVANVGDLKSAVKNKQIQVFIPEGSDNIKDLEHSSDKDVQLVSEIVRKNKWYLKSNTKIFEAHIIEEHNALIGNEIIFPTFLPVTSLFMSEDVFHYHPLLVMFNKNFKFKDKVNKYIMQFSAAGLFDKNRRDYFFKTQLRFEHVIPLSDMKITMKKLEGAIYMLLVGYGLAILTCCLEILHYNLKRR